MTINERNELVLNNLPLANKLAHQLKRTLPKHVEFDDLQSAAYFGLLDAACKFDRNKCSYFGGYARIRIVGEIKDFIKNSCKFIQNLEKLNA